MGLTNYANAIRSHAHTNLTAALSPNATWGTVVQIWENLDTDPPVPDGTNWESTSFIRWTLQPNVNPWISSGYVAPEGFLIAQCFTPQNIGPDACEMLAELVADQFRTTKRTFSSGAGVFFPAEVKQIGPDPETGFFQYNVRIAFRFQEAA